MVEEMLNGFLIAENTMVEYGWITSTNFSRTLVKCM
uniref:BLTX855 n=1 Tax=Nephila pilipes TaxID=299642 RepID=A0A076L391_NEPPI|nr:BLTX855 [Nephila pilipes]